MPVVFPFSAIVGQDEMKLALLVAAVDPSVGGVLVFGDRGTGKSTAVRSLAAVLPKMRVAVPCRYGCDPDGPELCEECQSRKHQGTLKSKLVPVPVVDLPLGATEDRVVGALDLERALAHGEKVFEPGLLARAHRGFLYIDEVNLLEDHLVDLLLDVAASGENVVEREGLSVRHPSRFVLVGSGNPEEGELRPQLLDRFGLSVEVRTPDDLPTRIEVVRRRDEFEQDPGAYVLKWRREEEKLRRKVAAARGRIESTNVPDVALEKAARLCIGLGTDGLRGELTLMRAARAVAALEGDRSVRDEHLRRIAPAARRLGELWCEDRCTFFEVTVGLCALHQVLRRLSPRAVSGVRSSREQTFVLLVPAPGEQHTFGLMMVGEFFRRSGWDVHFETPETVTELWRIVRHEWFAIMGMSVGCNTPFRSVAPAIHAARRASCNKALGVLVGGSLISAQPEIVGARCRRQRGRWTAGGRAGRKGGLTSDRPGLNRERRDRSGPVGCRKG
jgi:magnesium chelatase subunit I